MRAFLLASTALLCTLSVAAHAETAAERLKSRLEQARYEAAGIAPPPSEELTAPKMLQPVPAGKPTVVSNERVPLASISNDKEKDDLLSDAVAPIKQVSPSVPPVAMPVAKRVAPPVKTVIARTPPPPTEVKTTSLPMRETKDLPALRTPQTASAAPSSIQGLLFDNSDMPTFAPAAKAAAKPAPAKTSIPEYAPVVATVPVRSSSEAVVQKNVTAPIMPAPKALPPAAMPIPAPKPEPVPAPPVMKIAQAPKPAVMRPVQAKANNVPLPNAAHRIGAWKVRTLEGKTKDSAFCLMEASFDNDMSLLIGQRADGYSTLGVNYGIDMLQAQRPYKITVTLDSAFAEDFLGYAESGRMAIAQMGRKPSFFMALTGAQALAVSMPGVATVFDMSGTMEQLPQFEQCLNGIGAAPLQQIAAAQEPGVPKIDNTPVQVTEEMPRSSSEAVAQNNMPQAVEPVVTPPPAPAPVVAAPVITPPPVVTPPQPKAADLQWDAPAPAKQVQPMKLDEPLIALPAKTTWAQQAQQLLRDANVGTQSFTPSGDNAVWRDPSGIVTGYVTASKNTDVIDAAQNALDAAEKKCAGEFDVQMGIPESYGAENMRVEAQSMESKCTNGANVTVSSWLVTQQGDQAMAWEMQSARDQRNAAFAARDKMLAALKAKGR